MSGGQDELCLGLRPLVALFHHHFSRVGRGVPHDGGGGVARDPSAAARGVVPGGRHGAGVIVEGDLAVGEDAAVAWE